MQTGSHNPESIKDMIQNCENYDLTIGSRYVENGKTENSKILIWMSQIVNLCYRIFFKIKVKDVSNSFRLYKTKDLRAFNLQCNNFDIVEEILIKLIIYNPNYKIREIPITFNKRIKGESKRKLIQFIFSYIKTITRLLKIKKTAKKKYKNRRI